MGSVISLASVLSNTVDHFARQVLTCVLFETMDYSFWPETDFGNRKGYL